MTFDFADIVLDGRMTLLDHTSSWTASRNWVGFEPIFLKHNWLVAVLVEKSGARKKRKREFGEKPWNVLVASWKLQQGKVGVTPSDENNLESIKLVGSPKSAEKIFSMRKRSRLVKDNDNYHHRRIYVESSELLTKFSSEEKQSFTSLCRENRKNQLLLSSLDNETSGISAL